MDAEDQCCVVRCHAVLPVVGKCVSLYKDRLWTVEYRACGYVGTDTVRWYAIRAGGNPCRDIWKSAGRKVHKAGEGLCRQNSVACYAADSHTIPVLLYRSRAHKRSQVRLSLPPDIPMAILSPGLIIS